jgi:hypothetical protein
MNQRAHALADRLEQGARALAVFANALTDAEWNTRVPKDGRKVGVVVHHVASVYPVEIQLAQTLAKGQAVVGVTMDDVHAMNAKHAQENDGVTKEAAFGTAATQRRRRRHGHPRPQRRGARWSGDGVALLRGANHVSVYARGSRGPA